jgi:hypothetical protein
VNRLFSPPKNFDEKIKLIVLGIVAKLRIGIISTVLIKFGNKVGITVGPTVIPKIAIITETKIIATLSFVVFLPSASYTNNTLYEICANIIITVYT